MIGNGPISSYRHWILLFQSQTPDKTPIRGSISRSNTLQIRKVRGKKPISKRIPTCTNRSYRPTKNKKKRTSNTLKIPDINKAELIGIIPLNPFSTVHEPEMNFRVHRRGMDQGDGVNCAFNIPSLDGWESVVNFFRSSIRELILHSYSLFYLI